MWDFVPRLAAAAGLEMEMPRRGEHGPQLSAILYFIDLSHVRCAAPLLVSLIRTFPSLPSFVSL